MQKIGVRYVLCPMCNRKRFIGIGDDSIISLFDMRLKKGFQRVAKPRTCRNCGDVYIVSNVLCGNACGRQGIVISPPAGKYVCPSCEALDGLKTLFGDEL